jgi:AcrR family transcriptional regulator
VRGCPPARAANGPPGAGDGYLDPVGRPPLTAEQRADADARQRNQVLAGLAKSIGEKGYGATTVADIAAQGRISKSTVYAHFESKEDAFLELYAVATDTVLEVVKQTDAESARLGVPWQERVRRATGAYLEAMIAGGGLTRYLLIEAQAVSPAALAKRREVIGSYAKVLRKIARDLTKEEPELLHVPSKTLLIGAIGGMNELMLGAIEAGGMPHLRRLTDDATELFTAVLRSRVD